MTDKKTAPSKSNGGGSKATTDQYKNWKDHYKGSKK